MVRKRGQVDQPHAVRITVEQVAPELHRDARLADSPGPNDRHESVLAQERCDLADLALPPNEGGQLLREIVSRGRLRVGTHEP